MAYSRLILPLSRRTKGFTGPLSGLVGKAAMVNPSPHTSLQLHGPSHLFSGQTMITMQVQAKIMGEHFFWGFLAPARHTA